jgi:nucleoside-diphosphate-sugar epimerase
MRIFVTGWSGFIGSHLVPPLSQAHTVHCMQSDLLDFNRVQEEIKLFSPDIVVHLAARTEVEKSFYEQISFSEINYVGTVNLIESACKLDKLPYFVFASTMEVYGWQPISDEIQMGKIPDILPAFDESTTPNPNAPYAVAKLGCEKYLEYAHRAFGIDYAIIRQTNSYGRKDNDFFVTEQIINQMLTNPNECNLGYCDPYRNFIFIDDLIDAWGTVINNRNICANNIFTIGPDKPVQIKQHAINIATLLGWTGTINWNTKPKRHGEIYLLNSNSTKLTDLTGWIPKVTYTEGLNRTINIWKEKLEHAEYISVPAAVCN